MALDHKVVHEPNTMSNGSLKDNCVLSGLPIQVLRPVICIMSRTDNIKCVGTNLWDKQSQHRRPHLIF